MVEGRWKACRQRAKPLPGIILPPAPVRRRPGRPCSLLTVPRLPDHTGAAPKCLPVYKCGGESSKNPPFADFSFSENKPVEEVPLAYTCPHCHLNCPTESRVPTAFSTCCSWFTEIGATLTPLPLTFCQSTTPFCVASAFPALVCTWK